MGGKFSSRGLEDMKQVVKETQFYKTPDQALALFEAETFRNQTMPTVVDFCVSHAIVDEKPTVGFDEAGAQLNFDGSFIKKVKEKQ